MLLLHGTPDNNYFVNKHILIKKQTTVETETHGSYHVNGSTCLELLMDLLICVPLAKTIVYVWKLKVSRCKLNAGPF